MTLATEYVDSQLRTRHDVRRQPGAAATPARAGGRPCARVPLPGSKYCPSHKHLDEEFERRSRRS